MFNDTKPPSAKASDICFHVTPKSFGSVEYVAVPVESSPFTLLKLALNFVSLSTTVSLFKTQPSISRASKLSTIF